MVGPACSFLSYILALHACLEWLLNLCRVWSKWIVSIWPCLLIYGHILALPACLEWLHNLCRIWSKWMIFIWPCLLMFLHILALPAHLKWFQDLVAFGTSEWFVIWPCLLVRNNYKIFVAFWASVWPKSFFTFVARFENYSHTGRLSTNALIAVRTCDSVWALQTVEGAAFHSLTLG